MLLHPSTTRTCCRQSRSAPIIPPLTSYSCPYTTPRLYESRPRAALQRSQSPSVALNPPSTTRPSPLSLPQKLPDLSKYKYYFRVGKAYGVFYKNGLKAIWTNYKLARALPNQIFSSGQAKIYQAVRDGLLSRADFQLICRTRRDINKVPLFALLWLICGEFTPLVVIFFTGAVPRTLWIPKQVQKAREGAEKRRAKSKDASIVLSGGPEPQSSIETMPEVSQRRVVKAYAQALSLYPAWWDRWIPTVIPTSMVKQRVYSKLGELEVDDFAIERDGGVGNMEGEELQMACEERGIAILGKEEKNLRSDLKKWMDGGGER